MWDLEKTLTVSAALVQAFGSIVALIVAFIIMTLQSRRDDRRRLLDSQDWSIALYDICLEAKHLSELAVIPKDPETGVAFAGAFDDQEWRTVIAVLRARVTSDKTSGSSLKPALKVLAEISQLHATIIGVVQLMAAKQFPWDFPGFALERMERIACAVEELAPSKVEATKRAVGDH